MTGQALYNEKLQKKLTDKLETKDTSLVKPDDMKKLQEWLASGTTIELHRAKRMINVLPNQSEEEKKDSDKEKSVKENDTNFEKEVKGLEKSEASDMKDDTNITDISSPTVSSNPITPIPPTSNTDSNVGKPDMNSQLLASILKATMGVKNSIDNKETASIELPEQDKLPEMISDTPALPDHKPLMLPAPTDNTKEGNDISNISDTLRDISVGLYESKKEDDRDEETEDNRWDDLQQGIDDLLPAIKGINTGDSGGGLLDDLLDMGKGGKKGKGGLLRRALGGAKNMVGRGGSMLARGAMTGGSMLAEGAGAVASGASSLMSGAGALAMANPITAGLLGVAAIGVGGYMAYDHFRGSEESKAVFDQLVNDGVIDHDIIGDSEILNWKAIEGLEPEKLKNLIDYDDFSDEDTKKMQGILDEKNGKDGGKGKDGKSKPKPKPKPKVDYSKEEDVGADKSILSMSNLNKLNPIGALYETMRGSDKSKQVFDKLVDDDVIDHDIIGDSEILDWDSIETLQPEMLKNLISYDDFSDEDTKKMQGILDGKEKDKKSKGGKSSVAQKDKPKPKIDYSKEDDVKSKNSLLSLHTLAKVTPIGALYETMRGDDKSKAVFDKLVEDGVIDHSLLGSSDILDWKSLETLKPDMLKNLIAYDDFSKEDLERMNTILASKSKKSKSGKSPTIPKKPKVDYSKKDEVKSDKGLLSLHTLNKVSPIGALYETMRGGDKSKAVFDKLVEDGVIDHNLIGVSEILDWESIKTLKPDMLKNLIDYDDFSDEDLSKMNGILADKSKKGSSKVIPAVKGDKGSTGSTDVVKPTKPKEPSIKDLANSYTQSKKELEDFNKANPYTDENSKTKYDDVFMENETSYTDEELNKKKRELSSKVRKSKDKYIKKTQDKLITEKGGYSTRFGVPMDEEQSLKFDKETEGKNLSEKFDYANSTLDKQAMKYQEPKKVPKDEGTVVPWNGKDVKVSKKQYSMLQDLQSKGESQKVVGLMNALSDEQYKKSKGSGSIPKEVVSAGNTKLDIPTKEKSLPKAGGPKITGNDSKSPMVEGADKKDKTEPSLISAPSTTINNVYNTANEFLGSTSIAKKWGL